MKSSWVNFVFHCSEIKPTIFYMLWPAVVRPRVLANQFQATVQMSAPSCPTVDWATHWWLRSLSLTLLYCGQMQRPSVGLASLLHGHVRVHGEGKPEGGLLHLQLLQQDHLHVQQSSSQHLKLTVAVILFVHVKCHLSLKNHHISKTTICMSSITSSWPAVFRTYLPRPVTERERERVSGRLLRLIQTGATQCVNSGFNW